MNKFNSVLKQDRVSNLNAVTHLSKNTLASLGQSAVARALAVPKFAFDVASDTANHAIDVATKKQRLEALERQEHLNRYTYIGGNSRLFLMGNFKTNARDHEGVASSIVTKLIERGDIEKNMSVTVLKLLPRSNKSNLKLVDETAFSMHEALTCRDDLELRPTGFGPPIHDGAGILSYESNIILPFDTSKKPVVSTADFIHKSLTDIENHLSDLSKPTEPNAVVIVTDPRSTEDFLGLHHDEIEGGGIVSLSFTTHPNHGLSWEREIANIY